MSKKTNKKSKPSFKKGTKQLLKAARMLLKFGRSIIPVNKKDKAPLVLEWKPYQKKPPKLREINEWFTEAVKQTCIAVVCGKVSGHLEIIDFDAGGKLFKPWKKMVKKRNPKLFKRFVIEKTQHEGYHVIFTCPKIVIPSSGKLAFLKIKVNKEGTHKYKGKKYQARLINEEYFILPEAIETKGESSYCIVAPSPGYDLIQGDFEKLPKISADEREFLISIAQSLTEYIEPAKIERGDQWKKKGNEAKTPWEDFDERGEIDPILRKSGWKKAGVRKAKYQHYRRPGKNMGQSASLIEGKILHCFTSNGVPFEQGKSYSSSAVYALLEHGGDFRTASKALSDQGYGTPKASPIKINKKTLKKRSKNILESKDPCGRFDPSHLPSLLEDHIQQKSEETMADPIMITQSLICSLSAVIGKQIYLPEGKYFQTLFANLWTLSICPSGQFKTTALNKGSELAMRLRKKLQDKINKFNLQLELVTDEDGRLLIEEQIREIEKSLPILPEKSTAEGMLGLISERNGGMVICSEFGQWVENLNRTYNLGYQALLTNLYDVPLMVENVTKGDGLVSIERPFITINAVSTLTWVGKNINLDDVASGFFARFLIFYPPVDNQTPPALPKKRKQNDTIIKRIETTLKPIQSIKFSLSKKAEERFNSIHSKMYKDFNKQPEKTREIMGPYLKRWSPYILKIAMLLQVVEDPNSRRIKQRAIKGAKSIVDYAIKSTVYLFKNELGESEQQRKKRKLLQYIATRNGKVTRGQLIRSKVLAGSVKEYDGVIKTLLSEGSIDVDDSPSREYEWIYILK